METPFNVALLRDAVLWVEKETLRPIQERNWDQSLWSGAQFKGIHPKEDGTGFTCGTAYCLAGHLVVEAGLTSNVEETFYWSDRLNETVGPHHTDGIKVTYTLEALDRGRVLSRWRSMFADPDGPQVDWDTAASALLGITHDEAQNLFAAENTAEQIRAIATEIAAAHGEVL